MTDAGAADAPATAFGVFLFDTTHHALWAEEVAREKKVPAEVVPAPPESGAKCDLALRTTHDYVQPLASAFKEEGIVFRLYR